jgi:AcrR family transcriptional regulator
MTTSSQPASERILDAAAAMREKGLANITTKAIAAAAGYSEAMLYKHFADKQELLHRQRLHAVTADSKLSLPVILPVPLRELVLGPTAGVLPACRRSPLEIAWLPQPNWTQAITSAPGADLDAAIRYGALALAYAALELLSGLREIRDDLAGGKLASSYPELGALLLGRIHMPALPEQPPKGFWQLCSMTTTGSPTVSN